MHDVTTGGGHHKRCCSGDIENIHAIAAGTTGINQMFTRNHHRLGQLSQHLHSTNNFINTFTFHAHGH